MQKSATRDTINFVRREYDIEPISINGILITRLMIDPHVDKHSDHINDDLIKEIIRYLDKEDHTHAGENNGFKYFASIIRHLDQAYKLIWLLEEESLYIGVITAFKDRRIK